MRTTITLDDDVAALIESERARTGESFRSAVNRLPTSARVFGAHALPVGAGWAVAAAYLEQPAVRLVTAGAGHAAIAAELAATPGLRSDDVPDVEIAALAIEHGLVLASHDH